MDTGARIRKDGRLQFITHRTTRHSYTDGARRALAGGCRWIQLRMKDARTDDIRHAADELIPLCRAARATVIIDDRVDLVTALGFDGVHLGKNDMPPEQARTILPPGTFIGGTANTFDDIKRLVTAGVDYIGCGPFRFTTTKEHLAPTIGIDGYKNIISRMEEDGLRGRTPIIAIGGIRADDIPDIIATGVDGVAVSGDILNADDPTEETRKIISLLYEEQDKDNVSLV